MRRIHFIPQNKPGTCGAVALAMVLDSFGRKTSVDEISSDLVSLGPTGQPRIKTHQLANYAQKHGILVTIAKLNQPWKALYDSVKADVSVILNHRIEFDRPTGHFSLLKRLDTIKSQIWLYDPQRGPDTQWTYSEMNELWSPSSSQSQISGNVAIFLSERPVGGVNGFCRKCLDLFPENTVLKCSNCLKVMEPLPEYTLGCMHPECPDRNWLELYCPECDSAWTKSWEKTVKKQPGLNQSTVLKKNGSIDSDLEKSFKPLNQKDSVQRNNFPDSLPGESMKHLAEAVSSLPDIEYSAIMMMVESQKNTLEDLSFMTQDPVSLRDRAKQWEDFPADLKSSQELLTHQRKISMERLETDARKLQFTKEISTKVPINSGSNENPEESTEQISLNSQREEAVVKETNKSTETDQMELNPEELVKRLLNRLNQ